MLRRLSIFLPAALLFIVLSPLAAQQGPADDNLTPEQFTMLLKDEWSYLKEQTDSYLESVREKGEFETTPEFEARVAKERQVYLSKINARIKEQKFDTRTFGVLLKAKLVSYNADKQQYAVSCTVAVEAPYTIPRLMTFVPSNQFLRVQDTIVGGYRTSRLKLRVDPHMTWHVERPVAMEAKQSEPDVYFRLRTTIDITQATIKDQAQLRVIPKELMIVHVQKGTVYWREEAR